MPQSPPSISLVMATYNRAHTLPRAIESVLAQDFSDWELVVVDDGSTDDTATALARYRDPRVKVVAHPENRGVTAAKNTGFDHSAGEWITTLDSDDELLPGALSALMQTVESEGPTLDALACNCEDAQTGRFTGTGLDRDQYIDLGVSLERCVGEHWGFFRRRILGDRRFNPNTYGMEWTLWLKIHEHARWFYLHKALRRYHTDAGDRISTARFGDAKRDARFYRSYVALLDEEGEFLDILRRWNRGQYVRTLENAAGQFALEGDRARFDRAAGLLSAEGARASLAPWRALLETSAVARAGRTALQALSARESPASLVRPARFAWAASTAAACVTANAVKRYTPGLAGALSRVAGVTGRGDGREADEAARYFRAVAEDWAVIATEAGIVPEPAALYRGRHILEIGPGNTLGVGLVTRLRGSTRYHAVDTLDFQSRDEDYLRRTYEPALSQEGLAGDFETAKRLLQDARVFVGSEALVRDGGRYDLIVSRAALEHVQSLDALFTALGSVSAEDVVHVHKIDLRHHGLAFDSALDFLRFPDGLYRAMSSHDGTRPNRVRAPGYLELAARHGLTPVYAATSHMLPLHEVRRVRPALAPPFRALSEKALQIAGIWLVCVGPGHPLSSRPLQGGVEALPPAPTPKLSRY